MNMTLEEAIERLERPKRSCRDLAAGMPEEPGWTLHGMALDMAITALRPVSRERVERVWRGKWKYYLPPLGAGNIQCRCTKCGRTPDVETPFCPNCGAPMTDEAVQMVMERMEALKDAGD